MVRSSLPPFARPEPQSNLFLRTKIHRRPRVITLVDIENQPGQQHLHHEERLHDGNDFLLPPSPNLAYRDADYDTEAGVAATRPRASGAVVDMQRGTGRGLILLGGDGGGRGEGGRRSGGSSHGEEGKGKEGRAGQRVRRVEKFLPSAGVFSLLVRDAVENKATKLNTPSTSSSTEIRCTIWRYS